MVSCWLVVMMVGCHDGWLSCWLFGCHYGWSSFYMDGDGGAGDGCGSSEMLSLSFMLIFCNSWKWFLISRELSNS